MNFEQSLLIMIHCEQFTGYAVGVLEAVFFDAAKQAGYSEKNIYWSYKVVKDNAAGNIIECDYRKNGSYSKLSELIARKNIRQVIAFDLPFPAPVLPVLRKAGIQNIISYWGASMSSMNSGFKLQLKRLEWYLRRNKPDDFIFESESMRLTATHGRGIPRERTHVIPLGVDTRIFSPNYNSESYAHNVLGIPGERKIIFYSGHMEERKGVRVIIQSAIELVEIFKSKNIHFVLCGNKDGEALVYEELLKNTEARHYVTFAGYRSDIPALMKSSYIGVIASTGWDSFTMSSVEMMSSGLPLIVSNLQGLAETIENGVNGFHIQPGNSQELTQKINDLITSPERAGKFSKESRSRAINLFSRDQQVKNISHIISKGSQRDNDF